MGDNICYKHAKIYFFFLFSSTLSGVALTDFSLKSLEIRTSVQTQVSWAVLKFTETLSENCMLFRVKNEDEVLKQEIKSLIFAQM